MEKQRRLWVFWELTGELNKGKDLLIKTGQRQCVSHLMRLSRNIIHLLLIWSTSKVHSAKHLSGACSIKSALFLPSFRSYTFDQTPNQVSAFFRKCKHLIHLWNQISFITEMHVVVFLWFQVSLQCLESFLCTFHCVRQLSDPRAKDALKFW